MGVVFQAEDPHLKRSWPSRSCGRPWRPAPSSTGASCARPRLAAAIEHEHIVTIYQVGEDRGVPFLAMQLLRGRVA